MGDSISLGKVPAANDGSSLRRVSAGDEEAEDAVVGGVMWWASSLMMELAVESGRKNWKTSVHGASMVASV